MSAAVRSRTAARGWVTCAGNAIRDLFNQPVDFFALQTACDEFDMRLNALDNAQSMVELEIAEDLLDDYAPITPVRALVPILDFVQIVR